MKSLALYDDIYERSLIIPLGSVSCHVVSFVSSVTTMVLQFPLTPCHGEQPHAGSRDKKKKKKNPP
ncbi:hypothetical protein BDZ91DRAFT_296639 [Kalaharituber pfeilii]|nr:hypothetical protein BDZ91DRAFT_296639 [Kalaharituber pfeilii]